MNSLDRYMRRTFKAVSGNPYFMRIIGPDTPQGREWASTYGAIVKTSYWSFEDRRFRDPVRVYFVCRHEGIS